jgi:CHASE3 domain sensor protein
MVGICNRSRVISAVAALVIATGLVVVAMIMVTLSLRVLSDSFSWVRHTDEVLLQVAGIETNLVAAESNADIC